MTTTMDPDRQEEIQKKMRLLDKNQKAYHGDTTTALKKQADAVQLLVKENEALQAELANTYKTRSVKQNIQHQNTVSQLSEHSEQLEHRIQAEETRMAEYAEELAKTKAAIMATRRTMGGVNVTKEGSQMVEKQVKVLEKRLDQALIKFNEALAQNRELREQIDNLRRERVVFDGIYKKLERELHEKKKQMADIIEQSNLFYEERDAATAELQVLKGAAEKDMLQYEEHFRELELMVEADKQLKETLKQSPRLKPPAPAKKDPQPDFGSTTAHEEGPMRRTMTMKREAAPPPEEVNPEEAVNKLMAATGITDINQLLETFVQAEEQNFSLYNYVNDLHGQVEALEEGIGQLQAEYNKHRGPTTTDGGRQRTLRELEEQLARVERTSEEYTERTGKAEDVIHELRVGVEAIFAKLACTLDEMNEVLGTTTCTESTMMTFLGIIEQRTTELLAQYTMQSTRPERRPAAGEEGDAEPEEGSPRLKFLGQGPQVPFGHTNVSHFVGPLPSTGDNFGTDVDDAEDDRVLTQEELRAQTEVRLAAKEELKALGRDQKKKRVTRKKTLLYE